MVLPAINKRIDYEWGSRLLCWLPAGLSSQKVIEQKRAIAEALRADIDVYWESGLIIDIYSGSMPDSLPYSVTERHDYRVAIGATRRYETHYYDFAGSFPHLLVGGISGGGKSVLLRSILTQLATGPKPDLYLCDLKGGVELNLYRDLVLTKGFVTTLPTLRKMVDDVEAEMDRRYAIMERSGSQEWHGKRAILVMDELADLKARPKDPEAEIKSAIKGRLTTLSAKGRAAGVILLLCTQRPSADVVDGLIKTNIATSICFRTRDAMQSRIILDNNDAAELPDVPGRCIFQQAKDETLQTFYLSYDQAKGLLANCERKAVETHESRSIEDDALDSNIGELG
ncbi:FtsK/SpoIIIE domain-containing protein [Paenibacillus sp. strain BS8-2]